MDDADWRRAHLSDEHVLRSREVPDIVDAALNVRVEDASCVSAVVTAIERAESSLHEVGDPLEIAISRWTNDDAC